MEERAFFGKDNGHIGNDCTIVLPVEKEEKNGKEDRNKPHEPARKDTGRSAERVDEKGEKGIGLMLPEPGLCFSLHDQLLYLMV